MVSLFLHFVPIPRAMMPPVDVPAIRSNTVEKVQREAFLNLAQDVRRNNSTYSSSVYR